jgi:hypothetical protein
LILSKSVKEGNKEPFYFLQQKERENLTFTIKIPDVTKKKEAYF